MRSLGWAFSILKAVFDGFTVAFAIFIEAFRSVSHLMAASVLVHTLIKCESRSNCLMTKLKNYLISCLGQHTYC